MIKKIKKQKKNKAGGKKCGISILVIVISVSSIIIASFFERLDSPAKPPARLTGIPERAIWYGGADGGCWILIDNTSVKNQYYIECYFDGSGELWKKGIFELDTLITKRTFTAKELADSISGYSGGGDVSTKMKFNGKSVELYLIKPELN